MLDRLSCQPSVRFTGQGSRLCRTLLAVQQRQSPTPYVAGRICVRVVRVAAGHALECRLALPRRGVDVPARVAGAAGVLGRHFYDSGRLVREHLLERPPSRCEDHSVQPGLRAHVRAGLPGGTFRGLRHGAGGQVLEDDSGSGEATRHLVVPVVTHGRKASGRTREAPARSLAPVRTAPLACHPALVAPCAGLEPCGVGSVVETHRLTIARRHLADVPVDARHGSVIGPCGGFDLVADRCHPPTACALHNGLDGSSFGIGIAASPAKRQPAQAGKPQPVVLDADILRNGDGVTAPSKNRRQASAWCLSVYRTGAYGMSCSHGVTRRRSVNALPMVKKVGDGVRPPHILAMV